MTEEELIAFGNPPDYSESHWVEVEASTTESSPGVVIPDGEVVAIRRFKGRGESPDAFVKLVFDEGGQNEKVFHSMSGTPDTYDPDQSQDYCRITGNGTSKLNIVIVNNNVLAATSVGGFWEADIIPEEQ